MSANVETMFSVRETPWHGLVKPRAEYPVDMAQAREWSGSTWDVYTEPLYDLVGIGARGTTVYEEIPGYRQIKRDDTRERLSVVTDSYTPVTNADFWAIAEQVFNIDGEPIQYETAGVLDNGRRLWALCKLGEAVELPGDDSPRVAYLYLANGHDGKTSFRAGGTDIRIVCQNTEHAADFDARAKGTAYTFRHTKNVGKRVAECQAAITGVWAQIDAVRDHARTLLAQAVTAAQAKEFINEFSVWRAIDNMNVKRIDYADAVVKPSVIAAANATAATITALFESQTCAGITGNAYGLWSAAVEFLDYKRDATNEETKFSRTVLTAEPHKRMAENVLRKVLA